MKKLHPIKKNRVAHNGATPALSLLFIILFSFGFAQNTNNIFVAGASPAATTNNSASVTTILYNHQQLQNNSYAQTNIPDYCQTPANQSRPECHQYSNNLIAPIGPISSSRPDYCQHSQNQHLAECSPIILNRPPSPTIQIICSDPSNFGTPLCQEFFVTQPLPQIPQRPAYCREPKNQYRPECTIPISPPVFITPNYPQFCQPGIYIPLCIPQPRPCIVGTFDPLCNTTTTQPVCPPNYMPAPPPTMCIPVPIISPPITSPPVSTQPVDPSRPLIPPPPCISNSNSFPITCIDRRSFELPFPPASLECQSLQSTPSNIFTSIERCSTLYFTHPNAYQQNIPEAISRTNQGISFYLRSPFNGYPYVFALKADGTVQQLSIYFPVTINTDEPPPAKMNAYGQLHLPRQNNGNTIVYSINGLIQEVFFIILTEPAPPNTFSNFTSRSDLDRILLNLGMNHGIYHGTDRAPLIPEYALNKYN